MTVRDLIKRLNEDDMDKMLIWSDGKGWANVTICKSDCEITIRPDYSTPFSEDGCYATGGIVDPRVTQSLWSHDPIYPIHMMELSEENKENYIDHINKLEQLMKELYGGTNGSIK